MQQTEPEPTEPEKSDDESHRKPGGLLKRIHAQRPVFKRPVLKKVRRPIATSTTAKPLTTEDLGAFLVCSDGRCFDPSTQVLQNFSSVLLLPEKDVINF